MGTNPESGSWGLRHGLWLGAAVVLVLAVGAGIAMRVEDPSPGPSSEPPEVEPPPARVEPPPVVRNEPPPPPRNTPPPANPPPREETPPPAAGGEPSLPIAPPEEPRPDPFEPQDNQDAPIRTLVSVGDIQLGVVRESAQIRDEAGLKRVLVRIGDDLEKRVQEKQQQGAGDLQQVLDEYREELGKHMSGDVELRGPGFTLGVEVGPPPPREKWWKPRQE